MVRVIEEDLDEVLALKASAKSARSDDDLESAILDLQDAIEILVGLEAGISPALRNRLASELADSYGMMGGIERRWGLSLDGVERERHLGQSVAAYDEGFRYEQDLEANEASTYNQINRLISRVLLNPQLLIGTGDPSFDIFEELRKAEQIVTEQLVSTRQRDPWSYCDLGTVQGLLGRPEALSTFHDLDRLRPPAFVYQSALATLVPLAEVTFEARPDLSRIVDLLRRSAQYAD